VGDTDRFCSNCGTDTLSVERVSKTKSFRHEFSSKIILGGSVITPHKILIDNTGVTYSKRNSYLIGYDRVKLSFRSISSVRIDRGVIDADIIISGRGTVEIVAKNFSISDAKKIEKIITENIV
jgi:hypothetical protein